VEADHLVVEFESSGLTQAEFSWQKDLPVKTLARYVTRYRKQNARAERQRNSRQNGKPTESAFTAPEVESLPDGARGT
jgi:hypothetical protein